MFIEVYISFLFNINVFVNFTDYFSRPSLILSSFQLSDQNFVCFLSQSLRAACPSNIIVLPFLNIILFDEPIPNGRAV